MQIYLTDYCFSGICNNLFLAFLFKMKCTWESFIPNLFLSDLELLPDTYHNTRTRLTKQIYLSEGDFSQLSKNGALLFYNTSSPYPFEDLYYPGLACNYTGRKDLLKDITEKSELLPLFSEQDKRKYNLIPLFIECKALPVAILSSNHPTIF